MDISMRYHAYINFISNKGTTTLTATYIYVHMYVMGFVAQKSLKLLNVFTITLLQHCVDMYIFCLGNMTPSHVKVWRCQQLQ